MPVQDYERHFREHDSYWKVMPTLYHQLYVWPSAEGFLERQKWIVDNAEGDVLDCGCNDGTFTQAVRLAGHKTIGIDLIPLNIERARILYPVNEFYIMDVEDLKFPDESFDTVVFTETIEHLVDPRKALREIHRVLRPDGLLLCTTTYIENEPTHYQTFKDQESLTRLLEGCFTIDSISIGHAGTILVIATKRVD